jgi:hypothetical protein
MTAKTALGAVLLVIAVSLAGGGFYAAKSFAPAKLDPETLCPAEGARTVTLILIDKTDPLSVEEQLFARRIVASERDAARRGERIVVDILAESRTSPPVSIETAADLCNPGNEANPFFENAKRVEARYESAFLERIDAALASVGVEAPAAESPVARSIELALEALRAPPGARVKLILVSDLMEHGAQVSAYRGGLTEKALHRLMSPGAPALLKGAEVRIALLARPRFEAQQKNALAAWRAFFLAMTGGPASVLPL